MKIQLPHRVLYLTEEDKMLSGADKVKLVNCVLNENIKINNVDTTLDLHLHETFNIQRSIVIMDMLSYFITKEHRARQDIMTRETIKKMQQGDGRTVVFSSLNYSDKVSMGLVDSIEDFAH